MTSDKATGAVLDVEYIIYYSILLPPWLLLFTMFVILCRLSEHMEKFKTKLQDMYKASGGKKVDIISHSMGGILVKSFLALHHDVSTQSTPLHILVHCLLSGCINSGACWCAVF